MINEVRKICGQWTEQESQMCFFSNEAQRSEEQDFIFSKELVKHWEKERRRYKGAGEESQKKV